MASAGSNWAGTHTYAAGVVHRPASLDEARRIVASAARVRVLGTRHTFADMADSAELLVLDGLPGAASVAQDRRAVTCPGWMTYGALADALAPHGLAVHNLASLPHISVAGAIATATHGSGRRLGNLASAVAAIELLRSDGSLVTVSRGDATFDGLVVGLGAMGAVVSVTLDVEPAVPWAQRVYESLTWDVVDAHFDEIVAAGDSVSLFTTWRDDVEQLWVKERTDVDLPIDAPCFDARPASVEHHPILGVDPVHCTPQLGIAGPWAERLPHFRMGFTPSAGEEIQSELLLPIEHAVAAIRAMRELGPEVAPHLLVSEIRTVAADTLWASTTHGRNSVAIHMTWRREPEVVAALVARVEAALAPFDPRPHWGKWFTMDAATIASRYPRWDDVRALVAETDPRGTFRNPWLDRVLPAS